MKIVKKIIKKTEFRTHRKKENRVSDIIPVDTDGHGHGLTMTITMDQ